MKKIASLAASSTLTSKEATRIALHAQFLRGRRPRGGPEALVSSLRGVQLDTISVLARSHELVAYARLGAIGRKRIETAYWGLESKTFEYWSHAACILPIDLWPAYESKRRARAEQGFRWHELPLARTKGPREKLCERHSATAR